MYQCKKKQVLFLNLIKKKKKTKHLVIISRFFLFIILFIFWPFFLSAYIELMKKDKKTPNEIEILHFLLFFYLYKERSLWNKTIPAKNTKWTNIFIYCSKDWDA